jgi:hypothetical protein
MLQQVQADGTLEDAWGAAPAAGVHETRSGRWAARFALFGGRTAGARPPVHTFDSVWAARFRQASIASDAYKRTQALVGADRFDRIARHVNTVTLPTHAIPVEDLVTSELLAALTLDQHINSPGNVRADLNAAVRAAGAQPNLAALEQAVTAVLTAPTPTGAQPARRLEDSANRTRRILAAGLDPTPESFEGWRRPRV